MSVTFEVLDRLTDLQRQSLFEWGTDIFQGDHYGIQWRSADRHVVGFVDGFIATHVGIVSHRVQVGTTTAWVGGIGGVVTVPPFQKQGLARLCLQHAVEFCRSEWDVEYGFLFCQDRLVPYYSSCGWRRIDEPVWVEQPHGVVHAPVGFMVREFDAAWPVGSVTLNSWPW